GKKSPPAAVAIAFRLGPLGFAGPCLQETRVGVGTGQRLLTPRAAVIRLGALVSGCGLLGEGQVEHLLGKGFADLEEDVFDLGELGPPGRARGAVQLLDEVFRDSLDVGAQFFYLGGALRGSRHPWLLSELGAKAGTDFFRSV